MMWGILVSALAVAVAPGPQSAPVRVVTTLPIYAELAREIGGTEVEVSSIANPNEDAHFVRPKPSFALALRRADLFVTTGLDLELWVPTLLDRAGNAAVLEGGRGYVTAYTGIDLLDIPAAADRSAGDVHIFGNPHLTTDPLRTLQVARNITVGLKRVAPDRADHFDQGLANLAERIHSRALRGSARRAPRCRSVRAVGVGEQPLRIPRNKRIRGCDVDRATRRLARGGRVVSQPPDHLLP